MGTAIDGTSRLNTVADYTAAAMVAFGCQGMDCTLETVENVRLSLQMDLERLVVIISTDFALTHKTFLSLNYIDGSETNY
jgi:hypothetical protein